jgi:hypothetical protein
MRQSPGGTKNKANPNADGEETQGGTAIGSGAVSNCTTTQQSAFFDEIFDAFGTFDFDPAYDYQRERQRKKPKA